MIRTLLLVAVVVAAVSLGLVVASHFSRSAPIPERRETRLGTERTLGYLSEDDAAALRTVNRHLAVLTTSRAELLADAKDEIALRMRRACVRTMILDRWESDGHLSPYLAAAYADLFERVKDVRFVPATIALLHHEDTTVRIKAPRVAAVQAHPDLTEPLTLAYRAFGQEHPGEGALTRQQFLAAARASGGPHLAILLREALRDELPTVRAYAAQIVGETKLQLLAGDLLSGLADPALEVRFHATAARARLAESGSLEPLLEFLQPTGAGWAIEACAVVRELGISEAIPRIREHLSDAPPAIYAAYVRTLVGLGDRTIVPRLLADLERGDRGRELAALTALASSGDPALHGNLEETLRRGGADRIEAISEGLAVASSEPPRPLLAQMLDLAPLHPRFVTAAVKRAGDSLLPELEARARRAGAESDAAVLVVAALGEIGTVAAAETLERLLTVHGRLASERLRLLDLELLREGRAR